MQSLLQMCHNQILNIPLYIGRVRQAQGIAISSVQQLWSGSDDKQIQYHIHQTLTERFSGELTKQIMYASIISVGSKFSQKAWKGYIEVEGWPNDPVIEMQRAGK